MEAFEDPTDVGNSPKYHTGKPCIEPGCGRPAGTAWSPYWCFECNVKRIKRIDHQLEMLIRQLEEKRKGDQPMGTESNLKTDVYDSIFAQIVRIGFKQAEGVYP